MRFRLRPLGLREDDLPARDLGVPSRAPHAHPADSRKEIFART